MLAVRGGLFDCEVLKKKRQRSGARDHRRNGESDMSLRTSLNCVVLAAEAAEPLYRLRWQIELFIKCKCLKSGSVLKA